MKIINILFNYKKSTNNHKILGVERCFIDYAKYLTVNGNDVVSITQPNMPHGPEAKEYSFDFHEISPINQGDIFAAIRLAKIFFKFKADIVVCHSRRALILSRMARFFSCCKKTKIVAVNHGVRPKKFLKADYVLTVNSHFNRELIKAGKSPDTAFVVPNMFEVPQDFIPLNKVPFRKPIRFGSLGRLNREKNFDKVIKAMAILRDRGIECEYVIGGVGYQEQDLKDLARKLKLEQSFKILGWVEDKKSFFERIDIFLLPSSGETFGIVLLEAMLYSTPIITSNSWGPEDVVDNEIDGLKISRNNPKEVPKLLANAIVKLANNQDFARKMAAMAFDKFHKEYSADKVGKKINDLLLKINSLD